MLHTLIVACTIVTSSLTTAPNHRRLLAAAPDSQHDHEGLIIGYEQTEMKTMWGNTNVSAFNTKFSLGHVNAYLEGARKWDNTRCFIYQDNNSLIGGFQQNVTDIYGTKRKYSVKETSWGITEQRDGYEKTSIGMCKVYNHKLGDWGNSQNFIFVKPGVIAGFKQRGSNAECTAEWISLPYSWGIQQENDHYKEFYLGSCRAWNPRYEVWGYSTRHIYVNRKYLLPEEYKLYATVDEFDFGKDITQQLDSLARVTFVDVCEINADTAGYIASGSHCASTARTDSYAVTWSGSWSHGTQVSATLKIPTTCELGATISDTFTIGTSRTWTTQTTRTLTHTQGWKFNAQRPGRYRVGMKVWEIVDQPLPFTAKVTFTAENPADGSLYSGKVVNALLRLNRAFTIRITRVGETSVEAVVSGTMRATYAMKSERFAKEMNSSVYNITA
eukprot:58847_1